VRTAASPFQLVVEPGDVLALRQLADPALVRARPQMSGGVVNETYMRAAEELSDLLIEPFDVTKFERPRTRIIAEFVAGQTPTVVPVDGSAVEGAQVLSLLDALEAAKARQAPAKKPAKKSTRRATANA
jgi:non-homologous end joining protein Ku